jgi:hypothetical protein
MIHHMYRVILHALCVQVHAVSVILIHHVLSVIYPMFCMNSPVLHRVNVML